MKKLNRVIVTIVVLFIVSVAGLPMVEAVKRLPTGGDYHAPCLDYGVEMRDGKTVKSCLLAESGDFPVAGDQHISCVAKYSISFRPEGKIEYCTLSKDMAFRRTIQDTVSCKAGGRVSFYPTGTLEAAKLKSSAQLPYTLNATVACRADSTVAFRADGNVATCILDQEILFPRGPKGKKISTCKAGDMITFDDFGAFNGCYPPSPLKETAATKVTTQGGQVK